MMEGKNKKEEKGRGFCIFLDVQLECSTVLLRYNLLVSIAFPCRIEIYQVSDEQY